MKELPKHIVFYDGDCGFCNSTVQLLLNKNRHPFHFSPLQSNTAKEVLGKRGISINLDTIYYLKDGKVYDKSSAALQIARRLKGLYPLLFGFYVVPKFLRDPFYNFIAKRRLKIRNQYCMLPTTEERAFFLMD